MNRTQNHKNHSFSYPESAFSIQNTSDCSSGTFNTHELDQTGLSYFNARYYDADTGRFITPDPTVPDPTDSQAFNRYSFVCGNPISFIDANGYEKDEGGTSSVVEQVCNAIKSAASSASIAVSNAAKKVSEAANRITNPTQPSSNPQTPTPTPVQHNEPERRGTIPKSGGGKGLDELINSTNNNESDEEVIEQSEPEVTKDDAIDKIDAAKKSVNDYKKKITDLLGKTDGNTTEATQMQDELENAKRALSTLNTLTTQLENNEVKPKDAASQADSYKENYDNYLNDLND
jgi:RHS repeat-associated protein